ncbi:hypothetical protein JD844_009420 [Phrynosoma platyrhinos]|uniref:Exonuclease domain-containing protein n=1 Tax=Phrynosoma platyrhinos TaxID=52577 RepID=A0ABQ7TF45_PHRPL|nr:hypothetical protein JD844_009420 [Phrynosoma platyrhinos]
MQENKSFSDEDDVSNTYIKAKDNDISVSNNPSKSSKYTLDSSFPATDLEYDPLLNYCTGLKTSLKAECKNDTQYYKHVKVFPCGKEGTTKNSPRENRYKSSRKRSRNSSPIKLEIKLQESEDDMIIIDTLPMTIVKKPIINRMCKKQNRKESDEGCRTNAETMQNSKTPETLSSTEEKKTENTTVGSGNINPTNGNKIEMKTNGSCSLSGLKVNLLNVGNADEHHYSAAEESNMSSQMKTEMNKEISSSADVFLENSHIDSEIKNVDRDIKGTETIVLDSPKEKYSQDNTELFESDDTMEECRRIFNEFVECEVRKEKLTKQPVATSSGQVNILLPGNAISAVPCKLSSHAVKKSARMPVKMSSQRRSAVPELRSKVPNDIRQRYVNLFVEEFLKMFDTVNEAFDKALTEEKAIYDRCGSKNMYLNIAVNRLKKLRDGSVSSDDFSGIALYNVLKDYVLSEEELKENGFPEPNPEKPGSALLNSGTVKLAISDFPGGLETCYSCCEGVVGSPGCQVAKLHVHDGRNENIDGFVKTFIKPPPLDGNHGVFALDCEMCYTTHGLELSRVTVVDPSLCVVYEAFVKPDNEIIDFNTRLHSVKAEKMKTTETSIRDVQAVLLNLFSTDTILIGHSLQSDLFALKLFHSKIVDTSIVFPHRLGLPHKRALRNLMADYLQRIIQDDVGGHDCSEDATACMELMLWKVREDAKGRR